MLINSVHQFLVHVLLCCECNEAWYIMHSVNYKFSEPILEPKDPTSCFEQLKLECKIWFNHVHSAMSWHHQILCRLSLTETLQCQVLVQTSPMQFELVLTQLPWAGELYPMKWLGALSLPTPFGTDPRMLRANHAEPQMLTFGLLHPKQVPPLLLTLWTWMVRLLTVWLLQPPQELGLVRMVLLQQFHVSKLCMVININADFTDSKRYSLPANLFICLSVLIVKLIYTVFLLFTILYLHCAINLSICLPFSSSCFLTTHCLSLCLQPITIVDIHIFCLYVSTYFSACDKSSVLVITSEDNFLLCSSRENNLPGHFAWCTAWLPILDCKFCHYLWYYVEVWS